eukprot:TRINITY_DN5307_c0_g1_i1.p1 TRINITY_DN5307_c0_g1~~TRINITY_DN5307_c0_g1_i1.p1  ORF type:complete len:147 (+),score=12.24 TRINITY_DN5307_c0_g1_i1:698-1138(+)
MSQICRKKKTIGHSQHCIARTAVTPGTVYNSVESGRSHDRPNVRIKPDTKTRRCHKLHFTHNEKGGSILAPQFSQKMIPRPAKQRKFYQDMNSDTPMYGIHSPVQKDSPSSNIMGVFCDECGEKFSSQSIYDAHLAVHQMELDNIV